MVFETLVADLLNRFLGDFVDNLDASQLNIGIWGGDVKLNNLEIKETALDELDLPIKLKFGYLNSLVLKIPWKNLYTEPVIANIEGLYLIVVPNKGVVYNKEKAQKNEQDTKQKALARLEENRKNRRKPKDPTADSFAEKMVAQVIKNLQIKIKNIHIRFEDKFSNRHRPFAAGVTLDELDFQTTDENWRPMILKETVKIFHKLVAMQNLAIYWNSDSVFYSDMKSNEEIKRALKESIADQKNRPKDFKYILEPITIEAKLALNQKPEVSGFDTPKINLQVEIPNIGLFMGKFQYQDLLLLLEAQERFGLAGRYLKYRPNLVDYKEHYRTWWHFAYDCILEENVRRRRKNWSWKRIKAHRQLVRDYKELWVKKQTEKNLGAHVASMLERAEKELDLFNLNVARQQAELEIDKRGLKRLEDQDQGWGTWMKSWWSGGSQKKEEKHEEQLLDKFQKEITPEEKQKLFEAIDYQENMPATDYPKTFVENVVVLKLGTIGVIVENAVELEFSGISLDVEQRPSASAIHLKSAVKEVSMSGCGRPMLTASLGPHQNWLDLDVETNPIQADFDQSVSLRIRPVLLKYHAPAVNAAIDVFKPPEDVLLKQLTAAAFQKFEDVKSRSATGLQYMVDKKANLKVDIKIDPATIVLTELGVFDEAKPTMIAELGLLSIETTDEADPEAYKDIADERYRKVVMAAYDKFQIKLSDMHVIFADDFSKALAAKADPNSPYHVLKPTGLDIGLHKSSIDDLNMPKIKMFGDLPDIIIHISDARLIGLMKLLTSIPTPASEPQPVIDMDVTVPVPNARERAKMKTIMEVHEIEESDGTEEEEDSGKSDEFEKKIVREQQVMVDVNLRLKQISLATSKGDQTVLVANLQRFGVHFQMRTFDMVAMIQLGSLTVEKPEFSDLLDQSKSLFLVDSPKKDNEDLITMKFVQADEKSPFFASQYNYTKQSIDFEFKQLNLNLHQKALVEVKTFFENLQKEMEKVKQANKPMDQLDIGEQLGRKLSRHLSGSIASFRSFMSQDKKQRIIDPKKRIKEEEVDQSRVIDMYVDMKIHALGVVMGIEKADTSFQIEQITTTVTMKPKTLFATAGLKSIVMKDVTTNALHRYLLSVAGKQEMFHLEFTQYNRTDEEKKKMSLSDVDMAVKIKFAQLRFVFLNLWVNRMLNWISPFQAEAAQAAAQAQAIAAERATEAAQNVKQVLIEAPPRILLDIELAAPAIIVPRISTSNEIILVDLGHLYLKNGFNKSGHALIDELTIQLKDVHVSTGILEKGHNEKVTASCQILKPMSFALSVFRNLNFQNVKDLPELTVKAYLPIIDVSMSQLDYTLIMHTLAGNLTEGTPPPPAKPLPPPPRMGDANLNSAEPKKKTPTDRKKSTIDVGEKPGKAKRIVFKFAMDDINTALYSGNTGLQPGKGHVDRDVKNKFAAMKIHELLVTGFMLEDGGLDVAISLDVFSMTDERDGKSEIKQLMDKKESHSNHKFVNLKFNQSAGGDKDIVINSSAFYLILCPEFLGQLSSFFVVPKPPEDAKLPPDVLAKKKLKEQMASISAVTAGGPTPSGNVKLKTPAQSPEPQPSSGTLALKGSINDIEIILVENSLNSKMSQALILSFNCLLDGDTHNEKQHIKGEVKNLQIVSTFFARELRHLATYNVLNKMNIQLSVEIDMATQGQMASITMDTVHLKVSPAVIRLLSAVGAQFSENKVTIKDDETPVLQEYPNYWMKKKYNRHEYWWFNDVAEEATEEIDMDIDDIAVPTKVEVATFVVNKFVITLEAGTDEETIPMILVESSMRATAKDWSTRLSCDAATQLQISYYNEGFSVWEPVIEPVLKNKDGQPVWEPWSLTMTVRTAEDTGDVTDDKTVLPPKMQIAIDAVDTMNITVTKSFLMLLNNLSAAFEKAAKNQTPPNSRQLPGTSPYLVLNDTGIPVNIGNSDSMKITEEGSINATHGEFVELNVIGWEQKIGLQQVEDNRSAELCLELMDTSREVNVMRAETRSVRLPKQAHSGRQWTMVVNTDIENNRRIVTLKSLVSFVNHTDTKIEIHSMRDTSLDLCGCAETDEEPLNVAIPFLYTPTGDFFIRPANDQYDTSNESISWHNFETTKRALVRCDLTADNKDGIYFDLVAVEEPVLGEIGLTQVEKHWTVHIYPPMVLRNLLPFPIQLVSPELKRLDGGDEVAVNAIPGKQIKITLDYEEPYTAVFDIKGDHGELQVITFVSDSEAKRELYLGIHWSTKHRRRDCQLYCPYWLINNTGKELRYMPEFCIRHEPTKNPVLLPFADKNFLSKKKARVQIENSAFSDEFPLDTAGSAARVICKENNRAYELTVDIQVCQSGLTKVVSFSPFYLLYNDSKFALEVAEPDDDEWVKVSPESCTGLWPKQKGTRKMVQARYVDTTEASIPFPFTENFDAFCSIKSDHLGIYATCSVGESSSIVHVEPFELGMAPAQIMNATEFPIEFGQKGFSKKTQLLPWETAPFRWEDVTTHDRKFEWQCGDHSGEDALVRNAYSSFLPSKQKPYHYWVSFLHGRQRYFLITDDLAVMTTAQQAYEVERMDMSTEINIQGIGISVINNLVSQEIIYMGISCSGILWEQKVKNRFKAFTVKDIEVLEESYQKWISEDKPSGRVQITLAGTSVGVDFFTMILYKKGKKSEIKIRRNYANGLWMLYRQSAHQKQIHLKVNHLQIDNQLPFCVFPCVLAVVPPPKSIVADNTPKPFTELSMTMQQSEHSSIIQYKYLHVLVQEFAIRLDQGLINSLIAMFATEAATAPYNKDMFNKDLELAKPRLSEKAVTVAATQQKAFYDDLHISPLMIHLSFSQGGVAAGTGVFGEEKGKDEQGGINIQSEFINVLLKSVGVSLTELQDVVFKLAFFERRNAFYSMPQLQAEVQSHYTLQFIKQLYVLVLGLDIIGNPFGLVRDLSSGVEDLFYQPFQGAIQGPEEFAEGLALGVTSLFGHAVGGAAGAVSRITGTLGKGVAALTLDEDYQRKRQEAINRKPQNFGEGISRGARGLGQGLFDGVTGIVTKPVEGMKTGGVGGFVKGVGKGLVGVVARPVSGVVDFASSSLEAVKTVAGTNEDTKALRPPRVIPRDQIVRPYDFTEAIGYKFFRDTDRGKYADTDHYVTFGLISDRCVFIVTDKRVFLAKRQDLLGTWVADWILEYPEINSIKKADNSISFELKQKKKGILGFGGTRGKVVEFKDRSVAERVSNRVEAAFEQTT
ncbi:hypothetical protein FO519_005958 [Halicephalobus sp. NKZ332]|nr:hypothetical protein FO519_005958 [Halicephalobus sp. NKZ332]